MAFSWVLLFVSACSDGSSSPPVDARAREVADAFVASLARGDANDAGRYIASSSDALESFLPGIAQDFRKYRYRVVGRARKATNGFIYRLVGRSHAKRPPTTALVLQSDWKILLVREGNDWRVSGFETISGRIGPA